MEYEDTEEDTKVEDKGERSLATTVERLNTSHGFFRNPPRLSIFYCRGARAKISNKICLMILDIYILRRGQLFIL